MPPDESLVSLVIEGLLHGDPPPFQPGDSCFGQPSLLLHRGHRFAIEVLFWLDGTNVIHQHLFSGAFHVLQGSSVHSRFEFRAGSRVNSGMWLGDVVLTGVELLRRGDTRPIRAGSAGIHSLFHLDRPSVTLLVRTLNEADRQPQLAFVRPFLAFDPFLKDDVLARQETMLGVLLACDMRTASCGWWRSGIWSAPTWCCGTCTRLPRLCLTRSSRRLPSGTVRGRPACAR